MVVTLLAAALLPAGGSYRTFSGLGVTFSYPRAWNVRIVDQQQLHWHGLVDLSTDLLGDRCEKSDTGLRCGWPIAELAPGGVLVMVEEVHGPGPSKRVAAKPGTRIGLTRQRPGPCAEIHAGLTVAASFVGLRGDTVRVVACIREPGLERGKRQVAHVLRSLRVP